MSWLGKLAEFRSHVRRWAAGLTLAGLALTAPVAAEEEVLPTGSWVSDTCTFCDDGIGGWNLYWYDQTECESSCRCRGGNQICPGASAPRIYGGVEFLPLMRDQLNPVIFAARASLNSTSTTTTTTGTAPNTITTVTSTNSYTKRAELTEDDFSNAFDPGMRLSLGVGIGDLWRLEGSYLGNYRWSGAIDAAYLQSASPGNEHIGNLLSPFSHFANPFADPRMGTFTTSQITKTGAVDSEETTGVPLVPLVGLDYGSSVHVAYASELSMAEANLRRRLANISTPRVAAEASVLVGIRQVTLAETLAYSAKSKWPDIHDSDGNVTIDAGSANNSVAIATSNRLLGPQIGFQTQFLVSSRSWIDFDGKGALLFGRSNGQVVSTFLGGTVNEVSGDYENSEQITAFLGELSLKYNFQLTRCLTVNAGYNSFFLDGVALASRNLNHDVDTLINGSAQPDHSGRIVYHGPSLGLIWAR